MRKSPTHPGRPRADAVDQKIGDEVRARRVQIGMTQQQLGEALGVSFQQVQKYEKGANRIAASRLRQVASALDVPVTQFYGMAVGETTDDVDGLMRDPVRLREEAELLSAFGRIEHPMVRRRLLDLVKSLVAGACRELR